MIALPKTFALSLGASRITTLLSETKAVVPFGINCVSDTSVFNSLDRSSVALAYLVLRDVARSGLALSAAVVLAVGLK
jgi:hypothetical protein